MSRLRVWWRLSYRQIVRDWWRWSLGGLLIGAALSLAAFALTSGTEHRPDAVVVAHTRTGIAPRQVTVRHGSANIAISGDGADMRVDLAGGGTSVDAPAPSPTAGRPHTPAPPLQIAVPAGARVTSGRALILRLRTAHRATTLTASDIVTTRQGDPLWVTAGTRPRGRSEIALTRQAMTRLQVRLGSTVEVVRGLPGTTRLRVVGEVTDLHDNASVNGELPWALLTPQALDQAPTSGRVFVVDLAGEHTNPFSGGSTSLGGGSANGDAVADSFVVNQGGGPRFRGLAIVGAVFYLILPLLLPMLAVSAIFAVGLERRGAERRRLANLGVPSWIPRAQTIAVGALMGCVAATVALVTPMLAGKHVLSAIVLVPTAFVGIAAGVITTTMAARKAGGTGVVRGAPAKSARVRTIALAAGAVVAASLMLHVMSDYGVVVATLPFVLIVAGLVLLLSLSAALVGLAARLAPTAASRVSMAGNARVRWLSTPAAGLIGLAASVTFLVATAVHAPPNTDSVESRPLLVFPGALVDPAGAQIAPRSAVQAAVEATGIAAQLAPLRRVSYAGCAPVAWDQVEAMIPGGMPLVFAAAPSDVARLGGLPTAVPQQAEVMTFGPASRSTDQLCGSGAGWATGAAPTTVQLTSRPLDGLPSVFVSPAAAARLGLRIHQPALWVIRPSHPPTSATFQKLLRNLDAQGLAVDPAARRELPPVSAPTIERIALVVFGLLAIVALMLAAAERRGQRRVLRTSGVAPRDERLAEALATGGLALAGILAGAAVLLLITLPATGGDLSWVWHAISRARQTVVLLVVFPAAAAVVTYAVARASTRRATPGT